MTGQAGYESLDKLRKKVTHDIEHQIEDLVKLRESVAQKVSIEVGEIVVPPLAA